jgi:uncharacterized membrane protein YdbT with pleckstrin-like domain
MAEQTYMIFHPTRLAFLKWYAVAILLFILGGLTFIDILNTQIIPFEYKIYILLFFAALGIAALALAEVKRRNNDYAITNERVIERTGLINIDQDSITWGKISNLSFKQNLLDRIFGIGTIELWAVGGDDEPEIVLRKIPKFKKVLEVLNKLLHKR